MQTREQVLTAISETLVDQSYVLALWEGGAAAWGRVDQWSDIDLQMVVDDDRVDDAFATVEDVLTRLGGIDLAYRIPEPAWHGHSQRFYRLCEASPYLLIDLVVIRRSAPDKFLERELHGDPVVYFDKAGIAVAAAFDADAFRSRLDARRERLRTLFDMFQVLVRKEINRRNAIEAITYYQSYTLRPLVEALRMEHAPHHASFHTRYIEYELPAETVRRLQPLFYPRDLADLEKKLQQAIDWFREIS